MWAIPGAHLSGNQGFPTRTSLEGHFHSTDGGKSWTAPTGLPNKGLLCSLAFSPDESYVLFATASNPFSRISSIFESDDEGQTWQALSNPDNANPARGRGPFVATNDRSNVPVVGGGRAERFDLWFGDVNLYRATCITPDQRARGGNRRCPDSSSWKPSLTGAHADLGDIVFDTKAVNDACPLIVSSDGGVYRNTVTRSPDCHEPQWVQPEVSPHALWLWGMDGANQRGAENADLYLGTQDNGLWGTTNTGAEKPVWNNAACCDVLDVVADPIRVLTTDNLGTKGRNNHIALWDRGLASVSEINRYPPGSVISVGFRHPDGLDQFGVGKYVLLTDQGVFITENLTANPIDWKELGPTSKPAGSRCAVQAAVHRSSPNNPSFYVQVGQCMSPPENANGDQLWKFTGTSPAGTWQQINFPDGGGVGIFAVDPNNPNRLYASQLQADKPPRMIFSKNGGKNWYDDAQLDRLMSGNGTFKLKTITGLTDQTTFFGYSQPSLVAFDPKDPNILVAGGRDSGVFVSVNAGRSWDLVTDPLNSNHSRIPHLPRPWHVFFDHELAGVVNLYIGTQGRGVWRISLAR